MAEGVAAIRSEQTAQEAAGADSGPAEAWAGRGRERLSTFGATVLAIVLLILLYVSTLRSAGALLDQHFRQAIAQATRVSPTHGALVTQIQDNVSKVVQGSIWTRHLGVRVNVTVLGADGLTPLYVGGGKVVPPPPPRSLDDAMYEALSLLPALSDVVVTVPPTSPLSIGIFAAYAALLLPGLFLFHRKVSTRERARIEAVVTARDLSAQRARAIEEELAAVRRRLGEVEPAERGRAAEIHALEQERAALRRKLRELSERETELRSHASRASELEQERQALEDLLEETIEEVSVKENEISSLQDRLKKAGRREGERGGRSREFERLARRLRALYKNLEVDDRAITDLIALRDESMKLRAEEGLKRLDDDPETAAIRRKVGGLPPHLAIFELGFAGKGRIYYTRSARGGYRVLAVGAKNTQKQDLEYLSRLA